MTNKNDYISSPSTPGETNPYTLGFILGLFMGYIGLAIGLLIYAKDDENRNSFLTYWIIGYVVLTIILIVIAIIYFTSIRQ